MINRALLAYAIGVSAALVFVLVVDRSVGQRTPSELSLHKLNILEPDGTVRLVISGKESEPGLYAMNQRYSRSGRPAGLYFMNDEGTEVGGLIYSGQRREDGRPFSMVHFSMDDYNQDQALVLRHIQDRGTVTGLMVNDVPDIPYDYEALQKLEAAGDAERDRLRDEIRETGVWDTKMRLFIGRARSGDAMLSLHDAEGRERLVLGVTAEGEPRLEVYDENGDAVRSLLDR